MQRRLALSLVGVSFTWLTLSSCHAVLGLSDYELQDAPPASTAQAYICRSHADCPGASGSATATFCSSKKRCVSLQSEDCSRLAGPDLEASGLPIGSLFKTTGSEAASELARQRAVQLAVEEINAQGGIPAFDNGAARRLVLIGCDATADVDRAASHLATLGARAIVGLSDSEQLLQVVRVHAIKSSMLTLSTAIAPDSINSLLDADLVWLTTLTVEQRLPLLEAALHALEQHLRAERTQPLRLALLFHNDGAGRAGVAALRSHDFDGQPLGSTEAQAGRVRFDRYPDSDADVQALVASYRGFAPDIVVVLGPADASSAFMTLLEQAYERDASPLRPHYVLTEEAKGPGLIALSRALPSLRERIHGVATAIPDRSRPVWESFQRRYVARFNDELASAPRVAAAYDAVYALAYALAAIELDHEVAGRIAQALHWLEAPEQTAAPVFEVGPDALGQSFRRLNAGERVAVYGAAGDLHWNDYGGLSDGALEAFCVEAGSGESHFGNAPLRYEVAEQRFASRAAACDAWLAPLGDMRGLDMRAQTAMGARNAPSGPAAGRSGDAEAEAAGGAGAAAPAEQPATAGAAAAGSAAPAEAAQAAGAAHKTLSCGTSLCDADAEQCCVAMLRLTGPTAGDVSCQPLGVAAPPMQAGAAGSAAAAACALSLQCASDADCKEGAVCCADMHVASCKPLESCAAEMGRRLACKTTAQCPQGQQCCMHANGSVFGYTACEATCDVGNAGVRLCARDADCLNDAASSECNSSALLPALSVCWPRL